MRRARAEQTRATIVSAARDQFVSRGYRATSLRDIAAAAGISHPGLLHHFATKDELLAEVVGSFEQQNQMDLLERMAAVEPGALVFSEIARHNATVPGYLALFAALLGEASTSSHPAHDLMRDRYTSLLNASVDAIEVAMAFDAVAGDRDPRRESTRIAAAWDGLQLLEQYLPERVEVARMLETFEDLLALPIGWRDCDDPGPSTSAKPMPPMPAFAADPDAMSSTADVGYRVGRERRAHILESAMALFATDGYGDTSLRVIAERVGVSKSTLLHYYASKEELLRTVLSERDRRIDSLPTYRHASRAADELRGLPLGAAHNAASTPGLVEVYAVLSCEAVPSDHPAHAYFERRFRDAIDHFAALFRVAQTDGDLPAHRDPEFEAIWLVALWDGLQYQWLYNRDAVDVAAELAAHLDDVLPRR